MCNTAFSSPMRAAASMLSYAEVPSTIAATLRDVVALLLRRCARVAELHEGAAKP
jgi:hypothetical protein